MDDEQWSRKLDQLHRVIGEVTVNLVYVEDSLDALIIDALLIPGP